MTDACPKCNADFSYEVDGKTYSRRIGVEVQGLYDGVAYWKCPDCGHNWQRFQGPGRINDYLEQRGIFA